MKIISAKQLDHLARHGDLVEVLRAGFKAGFLSPERHVHTINRANEADGSFLLMPAWSDMAGKISGDEFIGLKSVVVLPDNAKRNCPSVQASYQLFSGQTGALLALIDGTELTLRRTAAASALAGDYLARQDASRLLMIGAGAMAPHLVTAHASVRPIKTVRIFNRSPEKAKALAIGLTGQGFDAAIANNLEAECKSADIVSCATTSLAPIILGRWLQPGVHIDLVGAFKPDMRETDGEAISKADVFVDTVEGAISEAGDLLQARAEGHFKPADIKADLFELTAGVKSGRRDDQQITLFKSSGVALEDLAAAIHIYKQDLADGDDLL